ncbi:MAG TPA: manganese efflux pump [Streptosporangiaceae bacterium]|nr:manganese efflux pump [Streptosporangiaceae bacterium]
MLALLLLAVALGLSNFAAAIGIGVSGVRGRDRVRIAVVFGVFEAGMPVLGVALGQGLASSLGHVARWLGGAALILIGVTGLVLARRGTRPASGAAREGAPAGEGAQAGEGAPAGDAAPGRPPWRLGRVVVSGLALSADNLAAGFALGAYHTGLAVAATVFGVVSVVMSLAGLELGAALGAGASDRCELVASVMLIAVGSAVAAGVF